MAHLDARRAATPAGALSTHRRTVRFADYAVIGGGWAGIAACVELALAGHRPVLFEAAQALGGRARSVRLSLAGSEVELDNGQHLLLGAYRESLRVAGIVGGDGPDAMRRARLDLRSTQGMRLRAWPLPAPLHLLGGMLAARGLSVAERLAMLRLMTRLRRAQWQAPDGETVRAMLERLEQPTSLQTALWDPLALAALNTPSEAACARTFARVLRDSLGARASDCDFVLPVRTLSQLLPEPAHRWLVERGATLELRTTARGLRVREDRWLIASSRDEWQASRVVLALPPFAAARLLADVAQDCAPRRALLAQLERYEYDSIATVYLAWPQGRAPSLPPWIMLEERAQRDAWGQWLFDRGIRHGLRIASVVVSARARLGDVGPAALAAGIARQVADQLGIDAPADARTVVEKRATFRCTPDRPRLRPDSFAALAPRDSVLARLALAGDYAEADYPATLESAVRSGIDAARLLMA